MIKIQNPDNGIHKMFKEINQNNSLLIIGPVRNRNREGDILYFESIHEVVSAYNTEEGPLIKAFEEAKRCGAEHIFLANANEFNTYLKIFRIASEHDFAFIAPIEIRNIDYFIDPRIEHRREVPFAYYLNELSQNNSSIVLTTSLHASLFNDLDHFLDDLFFEYEFLQRKKHGALHLEKFCYVANNLIDFDYANVAIASVISSYEGQYPDYDFGDTVYPVDALEIMNKHIVYFDTHPDQNTTVENLINFVDPATPITSIMTLRAVHYIKRSLDLSVYVGRPFSNSLKVIIHDNIKEFLNSIKGHIIQDFGRINVRLLRNDRPAGKIEVSMEITDLHTANSCTVVIGGE